MVYKCNQCGRTFKKIPFGDCAKCGAFQDFSEVSDSGSNVPSRGGSAAKGNKVVSYDTSDFAKPTRLSDVKPESAHDRIKSGFSECDRV